MKQRQDVWTLESGLRAGVAPERARIVRAAGHCRLQLPQLRFERREVGRSGKHVPPQRLRGGGGWPLVVEGDPGALLPRELACLERDLAGERAQQRRLAGAIRADHGDGLTFGGVERDAEEGLEVAVERREVSNAQQRHGASRPR